MDFKCHFKNDRALVIPSYQKYQIYSCFVLFNHFCISEAISHSTAQARLELKVVLCFSLPNAGIGK